MDQFTSIVGGVVFLDCRRNDKAVEKDPEAAFYYERKTFPKGYGLVAMFTGEKAGQVDSQYNERRTCAEIGTRWLLYLLRKTHPEFAPKIDAGEITDIRDFTVERLRLGKRQGLTDEQISALFEMLPESMTKEEILASEYGMSGQDSQFLNDIFDERPTEKGTLYKIKRRCIYQRQENARVLLANAYLDKALEAERQGDEEAVKKAMQEYAVVINESQAGARDDYEISSEKLDTIISIARKHGAMCGRLSGKGWGGTAGATLPPGVDVDTFIKRVKADYEMAAHIELDNDAISEVRISRGASVEAYSAMQEAVADAIGIERQRDDENKIMEILGDPDKIAANYHELMRLINSLRASRKVLPIVVAAGEGNRFDRSQMIELIRKYDALSEDEDIKLLDEVTDILMEQVGATETSRILSSDDIIIKSAEFEDAARQVLEAAGHRGKLVPKVATDVDGRPAVRITVENMLELKKRGINFDRVVVIVSPQNELLVRGALEGLENVVHYKVQEAQLGTGHAVLEVFEPDKPGEFNTYGNFGKPKIENETEYEGEDGDLLVMWGTMTVVSPDTLELAVKIKQALKDCRMAVPAAWREEPYAPFIMEGPKSPVAVGELETHQGADRLAFGYDNVGAFVADARTVREVLDAHKINSGTGKYDTPNGELGFPNTLGKEMPARGELVIVTPAKPKECQGIKFINDARKATAYLRAAKKRVLVARAGNVDMNDAYRFVNKVLVDEMGFEMKNITVSPEIIKSDQLATITSGNRYDLVVYLKSDGKYKLIANGLDIEMTAKDISDGKLQKEIYFWL